MKIYIGHLKVMSITAGTAAILALTVSTNRIESQSPQPVGTDLIAVMDISDSGRDICDSLLGVIESELDSSPDGLFTTVLVTGTKTTGNQPLIYTLPSIAGSKRVLEGRKRAEEKRREYLALVEDTCRKLGKTDESPIFMAVKGAVDQLRANKRSRRQVIRVISDLDEMAEASIRTSLKAAPGTHTALPKPVENGGISVGFCGYQETVGTITGADGRTHSPGRIRDVAATERLVEVWRSLFSSPESVTFAPFCPKPQPVFAAR